MRKPITPLKKVRTHLQKVDPKIVEVLDTLDINDWLEDREVDDHFINLTRNIISQQLALRAAQTIYTRFIELTGRNVSPHIVLELPEQSMRDVGLSWAKVKYVKDLAQKTISGEINLVNLENLSNDEVVTELTKVKGIGKWTAEMFLLFTLGREDIFSYGDLGLRKGFEKLYKIENPSNDDIRLVVEKWAPYQSYGSISLWHFLDNK